jgi:hypothetical protein
MATLKISDLSVGDWVQNGYGDYVKVEGIWQGCNSNYQVDIFCDGKIATILPCHLHPIPITAEILEKIGFERLLECDLFNHSESGLEVAFEDEEWMHTINLNEYTIHTISGVHHIQHLLRLYGCEKEINL